MVPRNSQALPTTLMVAGPPWGMKGSRSRSMLVSSVGLVNAFHDIENGSDGNGNGRRFVLHKEVIKHRELCKEYNMVEYSKTKAFIG
eukprot:6453415-Ditylum_brightwellii.AAC.1